MFRFPSWPIIGRMTDPPADMPRNILPWAIAIEGGVGLAAVGIGRLLGYWPGDWIQLNWEDALWGVLAVLPMLAAFGLCLVLPGRPFRRLREIVDHSIVPLFANCSAADVLLISVLAGLGEELMFRGVIQSTLADWLVQSERTGAWGQAAGPWIAAAAAAVVFGLLHAVTLTYALLGTLLGLLLGWLYLASGNLLGPIVAHSLYDAAALALLLRRHRRADRDSMA